MHLLALAINIGNDLLFIGNTSLLLLDEAVSDAFHLGADRVQRIVVVLDPILLLLDNGLFEFIPI